MKFIYDSESPSGKKISYINKVGDVIEESFVGLSVKIDEEGNNDIVELVRLMSGKYMVFTWDMGKQ